MGWRTFHYAVLVALLVGSGNFAGLAGTAMARPRVQKAAPAPNYGELTLSYERARDAYYELRDNADERRKADAWEEAALRLRSLIERTDTTARNKKPDAKLAEIRARAQFTLGRLYRDEFRISKQRADLLYAVEAFLRCAHEQPDSPLADDALHAYAIIAHRQFNDAERARWALDHIVRKHPKGDMAKAAKRDLRQLGSGKAVTPRPFLKKGLLVKGEKEVPPKPAGLIRDERLPPQTTPLAPTRATTPPALASLDRLVEDAAQKTGPRLLTGGNQVPSPSNTPGGDDPANPPARPDADESELPGPRVPPKRTIADRAKVERPRADGSVAVMHVVVPVEGDANWRYERLPARDGVGPRLFFDVFPAKLTASDKSAMDFRDAPVSQIRMGQYDRDTVRIVMDLTRHGAFTAVFDPARGGLIIDIPHTDGPEGAAGVAQTDAPSPASPAAQVQAGQASANQAAAQGAATVGRIESLIREAEAGTGEGEAVDVEAPAKDAVEIAMELKEEFPRATDPDWQIRTVCLDAGHGGHDTGAIGPQKTLEKNIALQIALKLADRIRKELGLEVILTRDTDKFIPLEERSRICEQNRADIFISIHCNANTSRKVGGITTFFLNDTDDRALRLVAQRENREAVTEMSDARKILLDLALDSNTEDSLKLARLVQKNMVRRAREHYDQVKDIGVRSALFIVLVGKDIPSILVETSFISNPTEEKRLRSNDYQGRLMDGIVEGLGQFVTGHKSPPKK
jgi:N-acetylmuramoyl-L-alanine amidase